MSLPTLLEAFEGLPSFKRLLQELPSPGGRLSIAGLAGSADTVLVAAAARALPNRLFLVVTDGVAEAERWLADMDVLADPGFAAYYPPREGFGEAEPHAEIAGERVETLERVSHGSIRVLITTARALLERTQLPRTLRDARLELRRGDVRRPTELVEHLLRIGFERVEAIDDVAQFSVRGGIFDIYGFGMADPVRLEFWGDEIIECRHFDLTTQRSTREAEVALILPVDGSSRLDELSGDRVSVLELVTPDTIVFLPADAHPDAEMRRTWDEAQHHVEVARRRGEDVPTRDTIFFHPDEAIAQLARYPAITETVQASVDDAIVFPTRPPETVGRDMKVLRRLVRDGTATIILCDNAGQAERLDELLNEERPPPAARRWSSACSTVGLCCRARAPCACSRTTRSSGASVACVAPGATRAAARSTPSRG
ncbi:MAG: hypothetical protein U0163_06595 [Gemmatimonadaceae bacterium]